MLAICVLLWSALLSSRLELKARKTQTIEANQDGGWLNPKLMQACAQAGYVLLRACLKIVRSGTVVFAARSLQHYTTQPVNAPAMEYSIPICCYIVTDFNVSIKHL
jgi:hypothetical protein